MKTIQINCPSCGSYAATISIPKGPVVPTSGLLADAVAPVTEWVAYELERGGQIGGVSLANRGNGLLRGVAYEPAVLHRMFVSWWSASGAPEADAPSQRLLSSVLVRLGWAWKKRSHTRLYVVPEV